MSHFPPTFLDDNHLIQHCQKCLPYKSGSHSTNIRSSVAHLLTVCRVLIKETAGNLMGSRQ